MKTQRQHHTRQLMHSEEVARHRAKVQEMHYMRQSQRAGWALVGLWLLWVGIIAIM